ncbi:MAG: kinase [Bosea sp.]|uniref:carbohydrate kinase family protein n=1 Tax=Bosea sp. (in: a-proteobacteria) TaxID=1871050 RepID=UPI001AC29662|nr:PfkB family carbohydrate kinase [Bosea sp. (in: a-proteobacteria)]MBN9468729.1 kinase [Bosea sp. (in: a-proteobacteria)]
MKYDYASIGFYTFDCLGWPFDAVPDGGGTFFLDELTLAVSGAAGTAAIAAAKMGLSCLAVGGVGDDLMGHWVLERLGAFGVDISGMQQIAGARTSSSIVTTRRDGSRPALHMKGATGDFYVADAAFGTVCEARIVHLGGVGLMDKMDPAQNARLLQRAKQAGAVTTVDVFAGSPEDLPAVARVLPHTDYFMPSVEEAMALTGRRDLSDMASQFFDYGTRCCIFTLGAEGASYHHADGTSFRVPAFDIAVKCTCGCGDAFNAGMAVALCREMEPEVAVRFAQATSALNATGLGSQAGVRSFDHTWEFMSTTPSRR